MSKIPNRSASCLAKLLRCLQDNWPAISHDLAVEATRFEGSPKATNAKMVVEEGIFSREAQDVFTLERQSGDACSHLGCNSERNTRSGSICVSGMSSSSMTFVSALGSHGSAQVGAFAERKLLTTHISLKAPQWHQQLLTVARKCSRCPQCAATAQRKCPGSTKTAMPRRPRS